MAFADNPKEAKKRNAAKRYLARNEITVPQDTDTKMLVDMVRVVVKHQPLTSAQIVRLARENHYVINLISVKQMWGLDSTINIVGDGPMHTVADLVRVGLADPRFLVIDKNIHRLQPR